MFGFLGANNNSNNMAQSSSRRPSSYSVTVSLACNKSGDRRTIEIPAGKTIQIGRSSKSGFKGLYASSTNALFDCAVVSRDHAELAMTSPWQDTRPRVTIMDKGSLHGTTVNGRKLENGSPFELHTGDVIELGEKITRGDDAHEGVSLTFKRLDPEPSYRPRSPSPTMNRGYQVPDSPDQEASDYDSDMDLESLYDYGNHESSAKTTPEQPKHNIGSQQMPINLEGAAGPSIIDLSQDEEEDDDIIIMSAADKKNRERNVIPETYDEDADLLVPESVPAEAVVDAAADRAGDFVEQDAADSDNDDIESVRMHNTGLCQILTERDDATSDIEEDQHNEEAEESEEEDVEYGYDSIDDGDGRSVSPESDLNNYESEPESDLEEPSEVYSSAHLRQDSPEPQDAEQSQQRVKTSTIHSVLSTEQPKPKAQYDPVRSSQPAVEQQSTAPAALASASVPSASAYVYGFPGYGSAYEMPATDFSDSSRWDVPPTTMAYPSSFSFDQSYYPAPSFGAPASFGAPFAAPPMLAPPASSVSFSLNSPRPQAYPPLAANNTSTSQASYSLSEASSSKAAGKIAITDIVDEAPNASSQAANEPEAMLEEAKKMVAAAKTDIVTTDSASNTKRKASEMETITETELPQQPSKKSKQEAKTTAIRSRSTVRRVATSAAQYATAAAFGGVATIAFLSSPYAQTLIDFLG